MPLDVVDLRSFYSSALGRRAQRSIQRAMRSRWSTVSGLAVLGLGFATPYLDDLKEDGPERTLSFMPGAQGIVGWPNQGLSASSLVEPTELPLRDSTVDRVLVAHALEMSDSPVELLSELWRVLAPGGRLICVVPNRSGVWSRFDTTPFGQGQPFSRGQITNLMRQALFTPVHWGEALYLPPVNRRLMLEIAPVIERIGASLSLPFAGAHVIEATKQVYRPVPVRKAVRSLPQLQPVLVPQRL
ncbi:MAG: class I SAM-dependent methyltransferase [Beijerinckiaceae bacterium]|nr:class I SAM-dependent methyltransferase [Beijerinckiaceae bacterium]